MSKASYTAIVNLPNAKQGDTFEGYEFDLDDIGSYNLTGATVNLDLDNGAGSLTTAGGGGLTITDAANSIFEIDKQVITFPIKSHGYKITFILSGGEIKTYLKGLWKIVA